MRGDGAVWSLLFCLPSDAKRFSSALAAATLFGSNIYFYLTADYFAAAAETQPLLHTWSLAVEEQFYIFFPLILLLVRRYFGRRERLVMAAWRCSRSALDLAGVGRDKPGAFYLLHSRAWELLLGALAGARRVPGDPLAPAGGRARPGGLALIAGSVLLYRRTSVPRLGGVGALHRCGPADPYRQGPSLLSAQALSLGPVGSSG